MLRHLLHIDTVVLYSFKKLKFIENTRKYGSDYVIIFKTIFGLRGLEAFFNTGNTGGRLRHRKAVKRK
jgi:hypothetical protein